MSLSMNKVILVGHLGRDPEIGETQGNKRYARLSLATSYSYTNKTTGEVVEKTTWHRIVCWGDGLTAFIADKVKKGNKLLIDGKLQNEHLSEKRR